MNDKPTRLESVSEARAAAARGFVDTLIGAILTPFAVVALPFICLWHLFKIHSEGRNE
jgi:hypothetical protein